MNRKGFTLIELLAVIILVALIGVLVMPSVIDTSNKGKQASYDILIKNIITASKSYYEECEYGDLSNEEKYGKEYVCIITDKKITIKLSALANTGFLSVKDVDENNKKQVLDPINNNNISDCQITITKNIDEKYKVTYTITPVPNSDTNCPTKYESVEKCT